MKQAEKIDLYKLHKADYATPKKPILLEIQPALYLTIDGRGEPGGEVFQAKIGALYSVAFTIKMTRKFEGKATTRSANSKDCGGRRAIAVETLAGFPKRSGAGSCSSGRRISSNRKTSNGRTKH